MCCHMAPCTPMHTNIGGTSSCGGTPSPWARSLGAIADTCPVHATHNWHGMAQSSGPGARAKGRGGGAGQGALGRAGLHTPGVFILKTNDGGGLS